MAKQNQDQNKIDPHKETLIVLNKEDNSIKAASEINEREGKMSYVDPISANKAGFVEIRDSGMLANFINNFKKQVKDPTKFDFFRVPIDRVAHLTDALFKFTQDPKDEESRKTMQEFRVYPRQLEKIKFDKCDIPWEELRSCGIGREMLEKEKFLESLMLGKNTPGTIPVSYKIGNSTHIDGNFGLKLYRDNDGKVQVDVVPPKAQPEFEEDKYRLLFSKEEKAKLAAGKSIDRVVLMDNKYSSRPEYCFVGFDPHLNTLVTVPQRDVKIEDFVFRARLSDTQKQELMDGGRVLVEKCKMNNDLEFSGKIQYDVHRQDLVATDMKYARPYIPEFIEKQLTTEQKADLYNYKEIDGTQIKGRDGQNYRGAIGMDRETNYPYWGTRERKQEQSQSQNQNQAEESSQNQSRGRSM